MMMKWRAEEGEGWQNRGTARFLSLPCTFIPVHPGKPQSYLPLQRGFAAALPRIRTVTCQRPNRESEMVAIM